MKKEERLQRFAEEIWAWYARHKRQLPWRDLRITDDTQRAYMVLVSEIMLQQTQVPRVIIIFKRFLEQFPTIQDLAKASNAEVILAWKGMGYNSRVLRLRDAAKTIVDQYKGVFPKELDQLLSIKGIGPYTAAAVRNFAFNSSTPCIDTNIRRILHRTFVEAENEEGEWELGDRELGKIAEEALVVAISQPSKVGEPPHDAANWQAALMDFGSLVQTKSSPKWDICPLTEHGIMMATKAKFEARSTKSDTDLEDKKLKTKNQKQEPGRLMGARYIPNRIFRGRIVDALREHPAGLTFDTIGTEICTDWSDEHHEWLRGLLVKLEADGMLRAHDDHFILGS
jgi:A/G-specific adenine glycosylase